MSKTILALDVETQRLASEVKVEYANELVGANPWARPDLFGFACGVIIDIESNVAVRIPSGEKAADFMVRLLEAADLVVGYNGEDFDLGVLSAYRSVEGVREHHVDLCAAVREALETLPEAKDVDRLRSGGLDGLAKANGLEGKTGAGTDAPGLYRAGRIDELLSYCEADTRLVADLYRMAQERGFLHVDPYHHDAERRRIYLPRTTIPLSL